MSPAFSARDHAADGSRDQELALQAQERIRGDLVGLREALHAPLGVGVAHDGRDVESTIVVDGAGDVGDGDHLAADLGGGERRVPPDVAEALDHDPSALVGHAEMRRHGRYERHETPAGRLSSCHRAAERWRLAGDDRRLGMADMGRVRVHEPRHDLLVRPQVGGRDVLVGTDEVDDLHRVAAGDPLRLRPAQHRRVDPDATLGAAERKPDDGALPRHQHGQRRHLAEVHVGGVADAALRGAHREQVLHPVAEDGVDVAVVVAAERERDDERPLRGSEPLPDVRIEADDISDLLELGE